MIKVNSCIELYRGLYTCACCCHREVYPCRFSATLKLCYSGRAVLSFKGDKLFATNLCDGIDIYKIDKYRLNRSVYERTTHTEFGMNKPVPIISIHDGADVLVGGVLGKVQALSLEGETAKVNLSRAAPAQTSMFIPSYYYNSSIDLISETIQAVVSYLSCFFLSFVLTRLIGVHCRPRLAPHALHCIRYLGIWREYRRSCLSRSGQAYCHQEFDQSG